MKSVWPVLEDQVSGAVIVDELADIAALKSQRPERPYIFERTSGLVAYSNPHTGVQIARSAASRSVEVTHTAVVTPVIIKFSIFLLLRMS